MIPEQQPTPWTFVQGPHDRFPRTQGLGQMQGIEQVMRQLDAQKVEADHVKNTAAYDSKKISLEKQYMQDLMEALKGGGPNFTV